MIVERMTDLIGDTPLLKIPESLTGLKNVDLYAKLEMMNPFGSVKDRVAWAMLKDDLQDIIENGKTIYENSSGNTAKAIAAIASVHGIPFKLVTSLAKVKEPKDILKILGVEIEEIAAASDCFDPNDPNDPQYLIEKSVRESNGKGFFTSQFTNEKNPQAHEDSTAKEILDDLGTVDYLISGLGTTGSTLGLARAFKTKDRKFICVGLCSETGQLIPGIRPLDQMWESGLYREEKYDYTRILTEKQALEGMLTLNRKMGLLCGPTAGGNFFGAVSYLKEIDEKLTERKKAVFIVCDRMEWYISYIRERMPELFGEKHKPDSLFHFVVPTDTQCIMDGGSVHEWTQQNNPLIIDIRAPAAYKIRSVPGSINIPIDLFEKWIDSTEPVSKDRPILLVCAVGEKTKRHAAYLKSRGYNAYSLKDGISAWFQANNLKKAA